MEQSVTLVLETPGGDISTVERMVTHIRYCYEHVNIIVPNKAMSAGTIFALSADESSWIISPGSIP